MLERPKTQKLDKLEEEYGFKDLETSRVLKLRRLFIKYSKVPIGVTDNTDGVFSYMLDLYDKHFNTKQKYRSFLEQEIRNSTENRSFHNFKEEVVNKVKELGVMERINELDMESMKVELSPLVNNCGKTLDNQRLHGKKLISVDMRQANYNTLRNYSDGQMKEELYEDWVLQFEEGHLFRKDKPVRQAIFGVLNPKRVYDLQRINNIKLVNKVAELVGEEIEVYILGSDEVVFVYTDKVYDILTKHLTKIGEELGHHFTLDMFNYKFLGRKKFGFVKEFVDVEGNDLGIKFTFINKNYFAQAYKHYMGYEVNEKDLTIEMDGEVLTFKYLAQ